MSVTTTTSSVAYTGDGAAKSLPVPFPFLDETHLVVTVAGTVQVLGLQYTVTGEGDATGSVEMVTAPAAAAAITITRTVPLTQATAFRSQGSFSPAVHELALDKLTMGLQQLDERLDDLDSAATSPVTLEGVQTLKNKTISGSDNTISGGTITPTVVESQTVSASVSLNATARLRLGEGAVAGIAEIGGASSVVVNGNFGGEAPVYVLGTLMTPGSGVTLGAIVPGVDTLTIHLTGVPTSSVLVSWVAAFQA